MNTNTTEIERQAARDRLAAEARRLRALRRTEPKKILEWRDTGDGCYHAEIGNGRIILRQRSRLGTDCVSSFGRASERSFSSFLPGLTLEHAMRLAYQLVAEHW